MNRYDSYKDSGVAWLGEVPSHWEIMPFKFLTKIIKGKMPKNIVSENANNLPPYLSMEYLRTGIATQFIADKNATIINENEILLLWDGSNAGEFVKSRKGVISSTIALINFKNTIHKNFVWYACSSVEMVLRARTTGMGIPHVNSEELKKSLIALPPFEEQTAIAQYLDNKTAKIDRAIELEQQQIELLKEYKQILIQTAVTRGLNPNVAFKDSGVEWLGEVPEHWEVKKVKNIFRLVAESAPKNNTYDLLSVYTEIGVKPRAELEERGNKASTTDGYWIVKKGDIVVNKLLAWMGAIGLSEYDGVTSPAYDILRAYQKIDGKFFHYLFRTPLCLSEFKKNSRGIMDMRLRLYFEELGNICIPLPSFMEQTAIAQYLDEQTAKIDHAMNIKLAQIEKLKEYKTVLINEVVTGKRKII